MARSNRPTVADLLALKGVRQLSKLRVFSIEEAEAAARAGVEMLSVPAEVMLHPEFRDAAPDVFAVYGSENCVFGLKEDVMRDAFRFIRAGADAVYCAASLDTIRSLRAEGVPVVGHSGLIPSQATWTGGFRAVGKTADSAMVVWNKVRALEEAGAFAAEIEVVPSRIARAITERTPLFMIGMGAGGGCDAQYLFADDVLGTNRGHVPRHSKKYRDFAAEHDRLQRERVAAFGEFVADVRSGAYPAPSHEVAVGDDELQAFLQRIGSG